MTLDPLTIESVRQGCYSDAQVAALIKEGEIVSSEQSDSSSQMGAGPSMPPEERQARREALDKRVLLDLWKATWEASQVMSYDEIRETVEATIREIVADEP